jgi:ABC-type phosphate/phosphonate transport system substrate-binding protein
MLHKQEKAAMSNRRALRGRAAVLLLASLSVFPAFSADFRIAVEPTYTPDKQIEVYKPLIEYLNANSGHHFTLVTSRNFQFFWRDIRQSVPVDFMFAEAHFTDYQARRAGFEPLVKTAENSSYSVLANEEVAQRGINSLIGYSVVTMPSPSLGFALLAEIFPDPIRQPNVQSSGKSWRDGVEMVFAEETDAAIVPTWLQREYPNLVSMTTTREFPGAAISAGPKVDLAVRQAVRDTLLKLHEDENAYAVLSELGISQFIPASAAEYYGYDRLLKSFFGYKEAP